MHTGTESRFLSIKSFSAICWPILMPNTENYGFSKCQKMVKIEPKSWFAYLQNPHKNLNTMAKYFFWFYKYRDVQRRKGVFNLKAHIPKDRKISNLIFVVFSFIDLPKSFSITYSSEILRYYFFTTSGPVCNWSNIYPSYQWDKRVVSYAAFSSRFVLH